MVERYLITAALPYVNNVPHIGNIVGSHLPADVFARYCRLKQRNTIFIGGTDEHGSPSEIAAQKAGIGIRDLCDTFYDIHARIYKWFHLSYDNFSRTSRPLHHEMTQDFFLALQKNGLITEKTVRMPFCEKDRRFLPDRFVEGTCPRCKYEQARGDQCEKCAALLTPVELLKPYCTLCRSKPVIKETKHLFLSLDSLQPPLKEWIEKNTHWKSQVRNLALGWIADGLKKRGITRDLKWGVKVPVKGYEKKVFYVWFDAPIGYISSTKEWVLEQDEFEGKEDAEFRKWWTHPQTKLYHFIGKDNIPFHTLFFPAMLMGGQQYILPHYVSGYQFLNYEGGKLSKSKGHGVFCESLVDHESELGLPADAWRFFLILKLPEVRDTDFTWKEFQSRLNTELIGNVGNFVHRVSSFIVKNREGIIPNKCKWEETDEQMLETLESYVSEIDGLYDQINLVAALQKTIELSAKGNQYFQSQEIWKNPERQNAVLHVCARLCNAISVLMAPVTPILSARMRRSFGLSESFSWVDVRDQEIGGKRVSPEILLTPLDDDNLARLKAISTKLGDVEQRIGKHKAQRD
ncbi:methionine--tRNA ligase [Candidatus Micrarchaeota archaeon]|nr:methionine--tRNA ligase [Candidatus Micrarchaeota archaeon]